MERKVKKVRLALNIWEGRTKNTPRGQSVLDFMYLITQGQALRSGWRGDRKKNPVSLSTSNTEKAHLSVRGADTIANS